MSSPSFKAGERVFFAVVLLLLPLLFYGLVLRPAQERLAVLNARIEAAEHQIQELPNFQPLSASEQAVLNPPHAPWKERIPIVEGDRAKLAHYDRVISLLQREWQRSAVTVEGVRSSWDPIQASFTLPTSLPPPSEGPGVSGPGDLTAWVMEVRMAGPSDRLFAGLEALPRIPTLLEPVGLMWDRSGEKPRQSLLLRNFVLAPLPPAQESTP
jgi:hypothetical protein